MPGAGEKIASAYVELEGRFSPESRRKMESDMENTAKGLSQKFLSVFKSAAFIGGMFAAIQSASNLNEEVSKSKIIFGDAGEEIIKFSKNAAQSMGLSQRAYLQSASNLKGLLDNLGLAKEESTAWSGKLVQLGSDLASFFNKDPEQAVYALGAALRGESEPLRQFNININEMAIKQKAMALGLYEGTGALDANAKAQATLALIMDQTTAAQGDFVRTADGAANAQRIQKATAEDSAASIGSIFLPAYTRMVEVLTAIMKVFGALPAPMQIVIVALVGLAALSGPIGGLVNITKDLVMRLGGLGAAGAKAAVGMGALGLVILAATTWYSANAEKKRRLTEITNTFTDALQREKEGQEGAVDAAIVTALSSKELTALAKEFGFTMNDLARIITGQAVPRYDEMKRAIDADVIAYQAQNDVGDGTIRLFRTMSQELDVIKTGMSNANEEFNLAIKVERELAAVTTETARETRRLSEAQAAAAPTAAELKASEEELKLQEEENKKATQELSDVIDDQRTKFDDLATAASDLQRALEEVFGGTQNMEEAARGLLEAVEGTAAALKENGSTLDINTIKGRSNREEVQKQADAIIAYGVAMVGSGKSNQQAADQIAVNTAQLRDQLIAAGVAETAVDDYIKTLGLTPENVTTAIKIAEDEAAKLKLQGILDKLGDIDEGAAAKIAAYIEEGEFQRAEAMLRNIATERNIKLNLVAGNALRLIFEPGTNPLLRFSGPTALGGVFDKPQIRSISEGGRREAVLPLENPSRLASILTDPRVEGPVAAAMNLGGSGVQAGGLVVGGGGSVGPIIVYGVERQYVIDLAKKIEDLRREGQ